MAERHQARTPRPRPLSPAGETNLPPITAPDAPPSTASAGAASLDTASSDDNGADAGGRPGGRG